MKWVSNASINKDPKDGSIFVLGDTGIKIHKYAGCGNLWFMTYKPLDISAVCLDTEDFNKAKNDAYELLKEKLHDFTQAVDYDLGNLAYSLYENDEFSRY